MTPGRSTFELTIRDQGDPLAARTGFERDPEYRLRAVSERLRVANRHSGLGRSVRRFRGGRGMDRVMAALDADRPVIVDE
jgi:hypothetical protein